MPDRDPKYFVGSGFTYGAMDYGAQPLFLVAADLTPVQDSAMVAHSDVFAFPVDLSTNVGGGGVQSAQTALETALIPAQWVSGSMAWATVARTVAGMFQFMQRLDEMIRPSVILIDSSTKLNGQWSSVPSDMQQKITSAAASLGYVFQPAANDQLRAILKTLADQWGNRPFIMANGFTF